MDTSTLIWFLGGMSACVFFLFVDRMREGKRITVMETKMDAIIASLDNLSNRVDLFLKTEVDTLKELAKR
jgi:hypothetical protein